MKLNTKNLSKEALEILALGKGYRSDDQSEMIIFQSPENILDFEINELENDDIPDFMSDNFGLDSGSTIKQISHCIKEILHADKYELVWLCSNKRDAESYADTPESVYEVDLPNKPTDYTLISDLGSEGCLVAYKAK